MKTITMNHGSGGRQMHNFLKDVIVKHLGNGILERFDDSAVLENQMTGRFAMTTDSYVVSPLFFEGGDIGRLCVSGTINDLSTSGAKAHALSLAFILEDGVSLETIERVVESIAKTAKEAQVKIVTGDTKVVEKGKGDKIYINTCGVGFIDDAVDISTYNAKKGDLVFITGTIGDHEIALMKARGLFDFEIQVESDVAPLNIYIDKLLEKTKDIHVVKDPTRGGVASALNEICDHSNCKIIIEEDKLPINKQVKSVSELLGFDPLYLANEGKFIIVAPEESQASLKEIFPDGVTVGKVSQEDSKQLILKTNSGGMRRVGMLETTMLPRIC